MFSKLGALTILSLCLLVKQSVQEECTPQSVVDLEIGSGNLLQWKVQPDEPCDIDEFLVHIFHSDQPAEYSLSVNETYANISFLHICEEWIFVVVPISGVIMGGQRRLVTKVPLPPDAQLGIDYINLQHNSDTGYSYLQWGMLVTRFENCSIVYRVSIEAEGNPVGADLYPVVTHLDLNHLGACTTYNFKINAINNASTASVEGPVKTFRITLPAKRQNAPFLLAADTTNSNITLSFRLESEARNPCPWGSLMIEGNSSIAQTIPLDDKDRSSPLNVTLDGLLPDTFYLMNVYVSNTGGWSDPTTIGITTEGIEPDLAVTEKKEE